MPNCPSAQQEVSPTDSLPQLDRSRARHCKTTVLASDQFAADSTTMEDPGLGVDERLREMGALGLMNEAVRIMRQNFLLFLSFAASFTIPCSIFTVLLLDAIDIFHTYSLEDFIAKGDVMILGRKFKHTITPFGLRFGFILVTLAPTSWLNTCVCTRGVVSISRNEELVTSIKYCFRHLHWAVLRLIAAQSFMYGYALLILGGSLITDSGPSIFVVLVVMMYHYPTPQVALLEREKCGYYAARRAMEIAYANLQTARGLAFYSVSYFCVLKLLVDISLRDSYPLWTKFLAYPPLVLLVIFMSIFWQVVYTLFFLSAREVIVDKSGRIPAEVESSSASGDVNEPLLGAEVDRTERNPSSQHETV